MATARKSTTEQAHPGPWRYIQIAAVLAAITAAEVVLYYMNIPDGVLVFTLLGMSAVKFALVALYFMHLKFDAPIFKKLFLIGITLAFTVYVIVLLTFGILR